MHQSRRPFRFFGCVSFLFVCCRGVCFVIYYLFWGCVCFVASGWLELGVRRHGRSPRRYFGDCPSRVCGAGRGFGACQRRRCRFSSLRPRKRGRRIDLNKLQSLSSPRTLCWANPHNRLQTTFGPQLPNLCSIGGPSPRQLFEFLLSFVYQLIALVFHRFGVRFGFEFRFIV